MKKVLGLTLFLMLSVAQAAQPIQRNIAPPDAACDKRTEGFLKEAASQDKHLILCVQGKWKELPVLVTWAEGTSILDSEKGCIYQINQTAKGLETALVGDSAGCGQ